ncbi:MAG TPA: hypothetical protein PLR24_07345 [Saprospiraceae bacterium]|nr:hypothetical protein [Saprospiraceae bacterium]
MDTTVLTYRFAPEALPFREVVCYVLKLIQDRLEVVFEENESGQLCFGNGDNEYPLMQSIYEPLSRLKPCEEKYLSGIYIFYEGKMDILASIFFIVHCLGESISGNTPDQYGRIVFHQSRYGSQHGPYDDLVTPLMREFLLGHFGLDSIKAKVKKQVILSHDIDLLTSGLRRELSFFFRKPSFTLAKALMRHVLTRDKIWGDASSILGPEKDCGYKSVFYFLPEHRTHNGIVNADYDMEALHRYDDRILAAGCEAGLHKSSSDESYSVEKERMGLSVDSNRNHYLRYRLPDDWKRMAEAGFRTDTGLGWSDSPGLRNGFPWGFKPLGTNLTVIPLVLMDTYFDRNDIAEQITETFRSMISGWPDGFQVSVLFHNNYLTPWSNRAFLEQYITLLDFLKKEGIEVVTPSYFS